MVTEAFLSGWQVSIFVSNQVLDRIGGYRSPTMRGEKCICGPLPGKEYLLMRGSARNAFILPATTTVSNVMQSLAHNRGRGMLWLAGGAQMFRTNTMLPGSTYRIADLFGIQTTNELLFEVRPLLYEVDTNHPSVPVPNRTASLVEFPAIRVLLHTNGTVENALNH